jgi:hypothetical protein
MVAGLVIALTNMVSAADVCSGARFNVAPAISLGSSSPASVAVADFNHDGKIDLAVPDGGGSLGVSILLGNGDGTFKGPNNVSAGTAGESIVVADFNGDGNSDLAVSLNSDKISILLGKGDGTFNTPITLNGGATGPTSLTSGDFNGDGKPDLALTNANSNNVSIFLSLGDGNFTGPTMFAAGFQPNGSSVGDFNGDGKVDLALAGGGGATILLGMGTGAFGSPATVATAGSASTIAVGDFNSDGKSDVAVAHFFSNTITILFGTGTGALTNTKNIFAGGNGRTVITTDLNGDGKADLLVANRDSDTVSIFNGDGSGNFDRIAEYGTGAGPLGIAVGDFNGDAKPDFVTANVFSHDVSVLKGTGGLNFAAPTSINTYNPLKSGEKRSGPTTVVAGDFNGDGKPDLAITNFFSQDVSVMLGTGSGTFGARNNFPAGTRLGGMAAGDFNNDGKTDLAVLTNSPDTVVILLGTGSGSFTSSGTFAAGTNPASITVEDINHDGRPDLAISNQDSANVSILLGTGNGGFSGPTNFAAGPGPRSIAIGDFNGDGNSDLVVTNGSAAVSLLLGNGAGNFGAPTSFPVGNTPDSIAVGDFDGDGKKDLAVVNQLSNDLWVLLGTGTGSFRQHVKIPLGLNPIFVMVRDFNNDGTDDIAVAVNRGNVVSILLNAGAAVFAGPFNFYAGASPTTIAANDIDADGKLDLVVTNQTSDTVTILLGAPAQFPSGIQFCATGYFANESNKSIDVSVNRSGDVSGASRVDYTTVNGTASSRSDYTQAVGTLLFAPGETTRVINVLMTDDAFAEATESFTVRLSGASGATLNQPTTAGVIIFDNDPTTGLSPVSPEGFNAQFFVRQHYLDFLNREPDASGLAFWVNEITSCGGDAQCAEIKRINVSAAFFLSIEFQQTGYLVERFYKAAFGNSSSMVSDGQGGTKQISVPIIRLQEFLPDAQTIGRGIVVGQGNWQQQLDDNKNAFALTFVGRQRFIDAFPISMPADQFVDQLLANAEIVIAPSVRSQLIAELTNSTDLAGSRASVLRKVAESPELQQAEFNRAFVLMQYFGYLRRNPNDSPDADFSGWNFWLGKLNQFNGDFINAEMVKAFLSAIEYKQRFGQ